MVEEMAKRYEKRGEFAFRVIAGEGVLVPIRSGVGNLHSIFTVNEVGAAIWGLIEPGRTVAEIVRGVCSEFDVTPAKAADDVGKFIEMLCQRGLIAVAATETPGDAGGLP